MWNHTLILKHVARKKYNVQISLPTILQETGHQECQSYEENVLVWGVTMEFLF